MKNKRKPYIIATVAFLAASILVAWPMASAYRSTRNEALDRLRFQARALAEQAANGIRAYLSYHYHDLEFLSAVPGVVAMDDGGKDLLMAYYREQMGSVRAVTRIDARGRILWSWPDPSVAGRDVSGQEHNARFLSTQKAVLSGVFAAVQGYDAVALTVPVREYGEFDGGAGIPHTLRGYSQPLRRRYSYRRVRLRHTVRRERRGALLPGARPRRAECAPDELRLAVHDASL